MKLKQENRGPEPLVTIRVAAARLGISPERLKQLEANELKGVLRPTRVSDTSRSVRAYSHADIQLVLEHYQRRGRGPRVLRQRN